MAYTAVGANHSAIFKYWNWNSVRKRANSLMISDLCFFSASFQVSFCSWRRVSKLFIMVLVAIMCHWPSNHTAGIYNPWFLQSSKTDSMIFLIKTSDVQLYHFKEPENRRPPQWMIPVPSKGHPKNYSEYYGCLALVIFQNITTSSSSSEVTRGR